MSDKPNFKILKTYMSLSDLMSSVKDDDIITNELDFKNYADILSTESIEGKIAIVQDRSLVNYRYVSSFWVQSLNYMKEHDHNPPLGVKINNDEWMVVVLFFKPCGDCKAVLSKRCRCRQKIGKDDEQKAI